MLFGSLLAVYHFLGIYMVGFLSSLAAALFYFLYLWLSASPPSFQHFTFLCISGAFHWFPFAVIAYTTMFSSSSFSPPYFAMSVAVAYLAHGLILSFLTCIMRRFLAGKPNTKQSHIKTWLRHRVMIACHLRFAKLLSGTEAIRAIVF